MDDEAKISDRGEAPIAADSIIPPDNRILFFHRDRAAFPFFSNFHLAPIEIDGVLWPSTEHFYQAQKCADPEYREAVRLARTPGEAKRLAADPRKARKTRRLSWFFGRRELIRPDWDEAKPEIMRRAVAAKFGQHPDLAAKMLATGTATLIEDSLGDAFWGIGRDGAGRNMLGVILMEQRDLLRVQAD